MARDLTLSNSDVTFHPASYCDRHGRLFTHDGNYYRALGTQAADQFRRMQQSGLLDRLIGRGLLIETRATDLRLDGYALVVQHKRVPFVTYANEWCELMLRDAALQVVDLEMELAPHGLTLADAHPWNMLFDVGGPRYVDLGSIVPASADGMWDGYETYYRIHFLWPLMLMARGHARLGRAFLHLCDEHLQPQDMQGLIGELGLAAPRKSLLRSALSRLGKLSKQTSRLAFLRRVRRETESQAIDADQLPTVVEPRSNASPTPRDNWQPKQRLVHGVLRDLCPRTIFDAGCGDGWYSELAAAMGAKVVAIDRDERAVTTLYQRVRASAADSPARAIFPVRMDLHFPAGGRGACNNELPPATRRLRCDLVLALGLIDALVAESNLDFPQIAGTLAGFCDRWLLVEYIDPRQAALARHLAEYDRHWYALDALREALSIHFNDVTPVGTAIDGNVLLLCRKAGAALSPSIQKELATV